MGSVILQTLRQLKLCGKPANIRKTNGFFFNGKILLLDETHVQVNDRVLGPTTIIISDIAEVRESKFKEGGET